MDFSKGLDYLKEGVPIYREGWNGKDMSITIIKGKKIVFSEEKDRPEMYHGKYGDTIEYLPYIMMKTSDGSFVPWLASQTDILADDWCTCYPIPINQEEL